MKRISFILITSLGFGSITFAHEGVKDPNVKAWMAAMSEAGAASKTLGNMAKGTTEFDAAQAEGAKSTLIDVSKDFPVLFETEATDPKSEALPAIWENYEDFVERARAMTVAAEALDVGSATAISEGIRSVGRTCGGCHRAYRE